MVNNVFAWYREYNKFSTQLTKSVYLKEGQKYFIDILHKQGQLPGHLSIQVFIYNSIFTVQIYFAYHILSSIIR